VPGIGPKTFEQAAGFLRIRHGDHPLDVTAVHPESYPVVEQIAQNLNVPIEQLIEQPALLQKLDKSSLAAGVYTLNDILEELRKPGRDPREKFLAPSFKDNVKEIGDLQVGMTRRRRHKRYEVRRLRRCRCSSGWTGAHQRIIGRLHKGAERYGQGWPDREGACAQRRHENQAHRPIDEDARLEACARCSTPTEEAPFTSQTAHYGRHIGGAGGSLEETMRKTPGIPRHR
jgi:hypothetical protein